MREKTYLNGFAIHGESATDFNQQLKAFCQSHCVSNITYHPTIPFLAYCDYEEREPLIVTAKDECEYRGERHTCGECHLLETSPDGRRKKLVCFKSGKLRYKNSNACEDFYEELKGALNEKQSDLSKASGSNDRERLERN